ncbi:class I SAM-dependent methyltransferase [Amycolatopsis umgeniensis]|uniref:SAM-dependent methyltransferase n=1 Tax=Amycolatopsis umgeniensis TaxID=336628 RepID=A0A841BBI3_9PSEU|nr:class I SAM-dependent methyltransferase [Amycolatopsis umgeniensis]MBB5858189.1 SAM-dependent methyltransferase [Amycolatopsis umgeniensis]
MRESVPGPAVGDAFGGVLRACHEAGARTGAVFQIVERDDGHIAASDAAVYFAPVEDWPELERKACEEITGRALDVGCGAGRHASVLIAAGVEVIGLDSSPGAVAVARARGVDARLGSASVVPAGISAMDTVVLFGNGIGLLGCPRQAPVVLAELARVAAPGARLLGSGHDPCVTTDPIHLAYHDHNRRRGRMPGHLRLRVRHEHLASEWFDYLLPSETELAELVRGSPWRLVEIRQDGRGGYLAVMQLR